MRWLRPWIDWSVLTLCIAAAAGAVIYGVGDGILQRPASGVLAMIVALAAVNCGILIGAAVCMARDDLRLKLR